MANDRNIINKRPRCRMAQKSDAVELTRLRWQLISDDNDSPIDTEFSRECHSWFLETISSNRWLLAVADTSVNTLAGCMCLQIVDGVPDKNGSCNRWGYLTNCYVDKPERNKKIGETLLRKILSLSTDMSLELVLVWPSTRAVNFYRRAGFENTNLVHSADGDEAPLEFFIG